MGESPYYPPPFLIDQQGSQYNSSMLFCGFFIIATAGLILAIYHCLALQWCSDYPPSWPRINLDSAIAAIDNSSNACKFTKLDSVLFKYKKNQQQEEDEECVVCLSVFEEDEDVRKLVKCNHSFHALCIDMWLFSHFDCPLCRAPVGGGSDGGCGGGGDSVYRNSGLVVMPGGDRNPV